jgi:sugar phosphate isomerase/epimerase
MAQWTQTGSSIIFLPYTLEQALQGLSEAGFENVEIGAVKDFLEHLDPDNLGPAEVANCQRLLDQHGLTVVSMSGHAPLHLDIGRQRLTNVLRAGREMGIQVLNTFTGDASTEEEIDAFVRNVNAIAEEAEEAGIRLCIETDSNLLPTAKVGVDILERIGNPWVGINYDPGNVIYYTEAVPEEDIELALPHLGHVHLKDKRGGKGVADFPPLGDGDVDIPRILKTLDDAGYSGPVSMEIEFTDYQWPPFEECIAEARRSKAYWDSLGF